MKESKKMGRPKTDNPVNIQHCIRLDKALNDRVLAYCKREGISLAEADRRALKALLDAHEGK